MYKVARFEKIIINKCKAYSAANRVNRTTYQWRKKERKKERKRSGEREGIGRKGENKQTKEEEEEEEEKEEEEEEEENICSPCSHTLGSGTRSSCFHPVLRGFLNISCTTWM
jgi:hypothetical protein